MNPTLLVIFGYLALVFSIGPLSAMAGKRGSREDFFLATRTIGPFLLLMSLFGTHMSAFSLIGSTGKAYISGIGTYGLMASSSALVAPLCFYFLGTRIWRIGKDHGYVTQCQYFRERWGSDLVGLLMFVLLVLLVIPYLLIGVMAGGLVFSSLAPEIPPWAGSLLLITVTLGYVFIGGMRGTAWANTFQTLVFMTVGVIAFVAIVNFLGGESSFVENLRRAAAAVADNSNTASRLDREGMSPWRFLSYTLIPLSVATFPHVNMHWLTARSLSTFKTPIVFYPLCILCVWLPTVLLGTFAAAKLPDVPPSAVLVILIKQTGHPMLIGLLAAGVLAAVMSSLDSQTLSLSEMFTTDIVVHYGGDRRFSERGQILLARLFAVGILTITWGISLIAKPQVFTIATWTFAGFTGLLPIVLAALFWPRSTKWGVLAAALTVAGLGIFLMQEAYVPGKGFSPDFSPFGLPVHPVAVVLPVSGVVLVIVSLLTTPPAEVVLRKFFPAREGQPG